MQVYHGSKGHGVVGSLLGDLQSRSGFREAVAEYGIGMGGVTVGKHRAL